MGEKQKYVGKTIGFDGIFNYKDLFRIMDVWLREKFYDKYEARNEQYMRDDGMYLDTEFKPWKKTTDYFKIVIKIEIVGAGLKPVEIQQEGKKVSMLKGKISIKLTGYLIVDYDDRWNKPNMPLLYFLRDIYDKYIYWRVTKKYIEMVLSDVEDLQNHIRSYLNISPYKQ